MSVLVIATITIYWQVNRYDFVNFDDGFYVNKKPRVLQGLAIDNIKWAFTTFDLANWHPITWLSHMLDATLYHGNPGGHHWTSVQIHVINTVLLFLVLKLMTGMYWQSFLVAALFALHPLHVESVAWISERKDVLSTFFMLLSLWAYVRYVRHPGTARYLLLIGLFSLGLMTKPMLVTLPCLLLLMDYWPLNRIRIDKLANGKKKRSNLNTIIIEKIPLFLLAFISSIITYYAQNVSGAVAKLSSLPFGDRLANAIVSYVRYLIKMVWPSDLVAIYPLQSWSIFMVIGSAALLLIFTSLVLIGARRYPYLITGWFWYLGTLVPVIGLVQVGSQSIADRYTYIPLIGIFIIIAWGWSDLTSKLKQKKIVSGLAWGTILLTLSICSWFQTAHWKNGVTLFAHAIDVNDDNWLAHGHLGKALINQQIGYEAAIRHFQKSIEINPYYEDAYRGMASILVREKMYEEGISNYEKALQIDPDSFNTMYQLAGAYQQQGRIGKAIALYQRVLMLSPKKIGPLYNLAWILATCENEEFRDGKKAITHAEKLSSQLISPQPLALDVLAAAYAESGDYPKAIQIAENAVSMARSQGQKKLADAIKSRLKLYLHNQSYRQPSSETFAMLEQFGEDVDIIKYSIQ